MSSIPASSTNTLQRLVSLGIYRGVSPIQAMASLDVHTLASYENVGKMTVQLAQMIYDSSYIDAALSDESDRVGGLSMDTRRNIYKVRQLTIDQAYKANYDRFVTNIMYFTTFVTMLCLTIGAMYLGGTIKAVGTAYAIIGIILAVYALIMVYLFVSMKTRTKTDWNQFYFPPSTMLVKAMQDAASSSST